MLIQTYAAESTVLRTEKLFTQRGKDQTANQVKLTELFTHSANSLLFAKAEEAVISFSECEE